MNLRFVERTNDGTTSYQVKVGEFYLGKVTNIRPGAWMAEDIADEFSTRKEAGEALRQHLIRKEIDITISRYNGRGIQ